MIKEEKRLYSQLKRARWILLAGKDNLTDEDASVLRVILDDHVDLALCHAVKEKMTKLFDLRLQPGMESLHGSRVSWQTVYTH